MKMLKDRLDPQTSVFCSHVHDAHGTMQAISCVQAWRILQDAYRANELAGKLGHTR
jgi:hypothetical protein